MLAQKLKIFEVDMNQAHLNYEVKRIRLHPRFYVDLCADPLAQHMLINWKLDGEILFMGISVEIDNTIKGEIRFEIEPRE